MGSLSDSLPHWGDVARELGIHRGHDRSTQRNTGRWAPPGKAGVGKRTCTALDMQPEHLETDPSSLP